jgi:Mg2+ and Co2+ transporter CorA
MMLRRQLTGKQKLAQYLTSTRSTTASVPAPAPAHPPAQGGAPPPKNGRIGSLHLTSPSSFSQAGGMGLQRQSIRMPGPSSSNGSHGQKMAAISADSHISNETRVYMRDVLDHINSCMHKIETAREILNQAQSNYLSQVSIQMARSAAATDNSMKKLTILATGLLPLTIVTSAFGMNVKVPFQEEDSVLPFFLILIVTVTVSMTATGMYFGRQRARRRRYSDDNV